MGEGLAGKGARERRGVVVFGGRRAMRAVRRAWVVRMRVWRWVRSCGFGVSEGSLGERGWAYWGGFAGDEEVVGCGDAG